MLKWIVIGGLALLLFVGGCAVFSAPRFSPARIARAETRMWKAYYDQDKARLGIELVTLLRNQYGLSLLEAKEIGELLASAAMSFRSARGDYERIALPDLVRAYTRIKQATGAAFQPEDAARAELAWWVARRTPGQNSVEQVGAKIAELYAVLHGSSLPALSTAGQLRAQAAGLRDSGGKDADWEQVEKLLRQCYTALGETFRY